MIIEGADILGATFSVGASGTITSGLTMWLDANNTASYPGTGTTWFDISGNSANVTLVNNPTFTAGSPKYFTFASASSQSATGSTANVLPQTSYTKSMWFYLNSYADNNIISSETGGHFMYMAGSNKLYSGHTNWPNYAAYPSTASLSLNSWYYAALTFNTTDGMVLYINGTQDSTYTADKSAHSGDGSVNVGRFGVGNFINGRVAESYCYNRSLTSAEILQNFNSSKSKYGF